MYRAIKISTMALTGLFLSACTFGTNGDRVPDSKRVQARLAERVMDVEAFQKIEIRVSSHVTIRQGQDLKLVVRTQEDHFEHLDIDSQDGKLVIDHIGDHSGHSRHNMIDITLPDLESLYTSGSIEAFISDLDVDRVSIQHDGIGDIRISGRCVDAGYRFSGVGDLRAYDMICENVRVSIDGIGDAQVFASNTIRIEGNGIGDIDVRGGPQVERMSTDGFVGVDFHDTPEKDRS